MQPLRCAFMKERIISEMYRCCCSQIFSIFIYHFFHISWTNRVTLVNKLCFQVTSHIKHMYTCNFSHSLNSTINTLVKHDCKHGHTLIYVDACRIMPVSRQTHPDWYNFCHTLHSWLTVLNSKKETKICCINLNE